MTILVFILHSFQKKLIPNFSKIPKTLFWAIFSFFCQNFGENEFSRKKGLCQFLNIPIIYHRAKNQIKLMSHPWGRRRTDGLTKVWQFKQCELNLIAGIELIPESLLIFKPEFFTLFSFLKAVRKDVETRTDLNLLFFLNLAENLLQEFRILKLVTLRIHITRVISIFFNLGINRT